jgi:signal transduction histidine kinase
MSADQNASSSLSLVPRWVPRLPQPISDGLLVLAISVITLGVHYLGTELPRSNSPLLIALLLLQSVPLLWRRRHPLEALAIILAAFLAVRVLYSGIWVSVGLLVAVYSLAMYADRRTSILAGLFTGLALIEPLLHSSSNEGPRAFFKLAVFIAAWLLGESLRTRSVYLAHLVERAARLEQEREEGVRRARLEEQARIGRELHDVIAHNLSVMVVQAAAADEVFDSEPKRAREALRAIETTGRQALTEVRRLLAVVEPEAASGDRIGPAPQPGFDELEGLVRQLDEAGLAVRVDVDGDKRQIPRAVELSAYRIVQEALTNTLRHANATLARVKVCYTDCQLELEVLDNGVGTTSGAGNVDGRGLIGMRERALLLGGQLEVGPSSQGGFAVHARLPLQATAS